MIKKLEYLIGGHNTQMGARGKQTKEQQIKDFKLGNLYGLITSSIAENEENKDLILPNSVLLEGTTGSNFYEGQKVIFDLDKVKTFKDKFNSTNNYLTKDSYKLEEVSSTNDLDLGEFGLNFNEIDFSKKMMFYSHDTLDTCERKHNMPFVIWVHEYDKNFRGMSEIPNHKFSYKQENSSNLTLNGFVANFDVDKWSKQLIKNGYEVKELEPGLKNILTSASDYKTLAKRLIK